MKRQGSVIRGQGSVDKKIGRWKDKKRKSLTFSTSKLLNFCLLLFTVTYSLLTAVYASDIDEAVSRMQKKYAEIKDVRGNFSQTSNLKDLDRIEKYEGKFFIKKPYSMRWMYSNPRDEEIIIRDTELWIYKKSEKQVLKSSSGRESNRHVPVAMISSIETLKTDFDISMIKKDTLEMKPKRQMGSIKKVILELSSADFPIKAFSILDINDNKIDIVIKNVEINSGLEDSFFIFKAPPGVEVYD
ncbi:MAG: outer membrane lipoprotein chaperone LolA, partial [Nitrospirota bacterium]